MNTQTTAFSNVSLDQFIGKKRKQLGALLVGAALLAGSLTGVPPAAASAPAVDTGGSGSVASVAASVVSPANSGFGPTAF